MAFQVIIIVIELMFLGINMFLALLSAHFNLRYACAKMILSRGQKHIYARERKLHCYVKMSIHFFDSISKFKVLL